METIPADQAAGRAQPGADANAIDPLGSVVVMRRTIRPPSTRCGFVLVARQADHLATAAPAMPRRRCAPAPPCSPAPSWASKSWAAPSSAGAGGRRPCKLRGSPQCHRLQWREDRHPEPGRQCDPRTPRPDYGGLLKRAGLNVDLLDDGRHAAATPEQSRALRSAAAGASSSPPGPASPSPTLYSTPPSVARASGLGLAGSRMPRWNA